MMSQGGEAVAGSDSSFVEALRGSDCQTDKCVTALHYQNHQVVDVSQGHASLAPNYQPWSSSTGPATVSWNFYRTDNNPNESGPATSSGYHYDPQKEMAALGDGQGGMSSASHASTPPNAAVVNAAQNYAGYAPYSNSSASYDYSKPDCQGYYYGYQQPANNSSQQGANQISGAAYQPLSSFQNTGSYNSHASYSSTYYNAGDHQTAGYQNSSYSNQTNMWNDGNYGSYPSHLYSNYTSSDTNSAQSSNTVAPNTLHYQQQYNQWPNYYGQSVPSFSGAPGTEKSSAATVSTAGCLIQGGGGSPYTSNQPPPPGTTSWRTDSGSSGLPSLQEKRDVPVYNSNGSWQAGALGFQNPNANQVTQGFQNPNANQVTSYFQNPLDSNPFPYGNHEDQHKALYSQSPSLQLSSTNLSSENIQAPLQAVAVPDARRVSKVQIPTNPRIASNLALAKTDKESSTTNAATKPAYISVSVPKPSNNLSSHEDAEAIIKGTFPPSLRAYVERTFARCKDDAQRSANQTIMKEIITGASADGSLFTKNWDMEPLFPLPNYDTNMADQNSTPTISKYRRSPSRRSKSRWEPIADEKLVEKLPSVNNKSTKRFSWDSKGTERETDSRNHENRDNSGKGFKFVTSLQQTPLSKFTHRPVKKPRFGDSLNALENGDASSDSDKEKELTKYYSSAIALANSPEEKKRREYRFKRFEKGQENQGEIKQLRPKVAGTGNIYVRRASAMLLAKSSDDGCSRVVEDIDWDALTVKGTCQEVEKRYLRLTSAPDPGSVRPEEILEKALQMVKNSEKNYLYKCDQLKSIRQDLTVQRIQNELTVKVYETHARLALEAGDLPEYNQCQSQLKRLYAEGIKGCHMEFAAYNLLYVCLNSNNKRDLLSSMTRLSDETKDDEAVKHALAVRSAVSSGNYILFFRLYTAAPNLNTCLMDLYAEKMRFEAVKCMSKSYRPTVPITYIARVLGFFRAIPVQGCEDKDIDGSEDCEEWLKAHGAVLTVDSTGELQMDTKVSSSSLYMPEQEDGVAHGDASLAVDDFLTRTS